jgi:hypothetical protein
MNECLYVKKDNLSFAYLQAYEWIFRTICFNPPPFGENPGGCVLEQGSHAMSGLSILLPFCFP